MTDLHSTLDAIDAATGCQQCEGPLGSSPSGDFCGPTCQATWQALRVGAPIPVAAVEPVVGWSCGLCPASGCGLPEDQAYQDLAAHMAAEHNA